MLDLEQQANQALASLDEDWHLLEGERTTFAIFLLPFVHLLLGRRAKLGRAISCCSKFKSRKKKGVTFRNIRIPLSSSDKFEEIPLHRSVRNQNLNASL